MGFTSNSRVGTPAPITPIGEFLDRPLKIMLFPVCNSGYKFLQNGFCVKDITSGTYYLERRNEEMTSSELISVQVFLQNSNIQPQCTRHWQVQRSTSLAPLSRLNFFYFHAIFSSKNCQIVAWGTPLYKILDPPLLKES